MNKERAYSAMKLKRIEEVSTIMFFRIRLHLVKTVKMFDGRRRLPEFNVCSDSDLCMEAYI
jgi:hypothetical protein